MATSVGKCMRIRHIVRLLQIVKKWRNIAKARKCFLKLKVISKSCCVPEDVPCGHLAVYVGERCTSRFVIRATYLNHPVFRALLQEAEHEFGFSQPGGLAIPCDESLFQHILRLFGSFDPKSITHLDLEDIKSNFSADCSSVDKLGSARLLPALSEKSVG